MIEQWRDVARFEGIYQVSDLGRVRSLERYTPALSKSRRRHREKIMSVQYRHGRALLILSRGRGVVKYIRELVYIDRLVWETFSGPVPAGFRVVRIDDDLKNNALGNLKLREIQAPVGSL